MLARTFPAIALAVRWPPSFSSGSQNRFSANDRRNGSTGISLSQEIQAPQIVGNRLDNLDFWGIFTLVTLARLDIVENRLGQMRHRIARAPF
ncbi:MAG: hypothetical protein U1E67_12975 [Hyphomicrobiales bacterium]